MDLNTEILIHCCCSSGVFRISTAVILNGTNVSSSNTSPHYGASDPNEEYVFLIYNLGNNIDSTRVQITANTAAGTLPSNILTAASDLLWG